jgi:hypothetical protein
MSKLDLQQAIFEIFLGEKKNRIIFFHRKNSSYLQNKKIEGGKKKNNVIDNLGF